MPIYNAEEILHLTGGNVLGIFRALGGTQQYTHLNSSKMENQVGFASHSLSRTKWGLPQSSLLECLQSKLPIEKLRKP